MNIKKKEESSSHPCKDSTILVDGSSYLYRAFHASEKADLKTSSGQPTGAIRVITNMLRKLMLDYPKSTIIVVFDAKGKNFRHDMYSEYKSNRKAMPDDLKSQVQYIHQVIHALGLPLITIENVEADDVIGTFAAQAKKKERPILISTGDKDMAQLVCKHVNIIDTMKNEVLDLQAVKTKFGVGANLIIDYLALMGDKSDNIPGMPGVGKKTAIYLLNEVGGIDKIKKNLDQIERLKFRGNKTFRNNFNEHESIINLSKKLATIKTDVKLPYNLNEFSNNHINKKELIDIFKKLEFKTFIKDLSSEENIDNEKLKINQNYKIILTKIEFEQWLSTLSQYSTVAFDTETTSLNYMTAELVGISMAVEKNMAVYIPLMHDYIGVPKQLSCTWVLHQLKPILNNNHITIIGQNIKYDQSILARYGINITSNIFDTMLESYVYNSTATRHNMSALALQYLNYQCIDFEDIAGKGKNQLTFNQIDIASAGQYASEDADITLQLHQYFYPLLEKETKLLEIIKNIEFPLIEVLSTIERNGALLDTKILKQQSTDLQKQLTKIENEVYSLANEEFNLSSTKQLQVILFEKFKLPIIKKTPKGKPSTSEEVLIELALDYLLPKHIIKHRQLSKLKTTYTDKLPMMVNINTKRIHTSYHQAVTATGRLSSANPNLQNIPIKTEEGRKIRQAFIAENNCLIVTADYSQIELRIMAHLSNDSTLLSAFHNKIDIHKSTASEVFSVSINNVSNQQRRSAKAINFGLIYGMSAFGLAKQLNISTTSAQEYINLYFLRYPKVKDYIENIKEQAKKTGYVETMLGRRLHLPAIYSKNVIQRKAAERSAINAPMQGTAADLIKIAMINIHEYLKKSQYKTKLIMQVHDELIFEVPNSEENEIKTIIEKKMSNALTLNVPLEVSIGSGLNWDKAH